MIFFSKNMLRLQKDFIMIFEDERGKVNDTKILRIL